MLISIHLVNLAVVMKITSCDSGKCGDSGKFVVPGESIGSVATPFLECAKHLIRVACNTRVILISMNFRTSNFACSQVDPTASLVSEQFLFSL